MKTYLRCGVGVGLVAFGYLLGTSGALKPTAARAQQAAPTMTMETAQKLKDVHQALAVAAAALQGEGLYTPATKNMNVFAVASGGVNAMDDLESGRGVDPETFAALYAGLATDEVAQSLGRDEEGRLTYKGKVIRMASISRLKKLYAERARLTGDVTESGL